MEQVGTRMWGEDGTPCKTQMCIIVPIFCWWEIPLKAKWICGAKTFTFSTIFIDSIDCGGGIKSERNHSNLPWPHLQKLHIRHVLNSWWFNHLFLPLTGGSIVICFPPVKKAETFAIRAPLVEKKTPVSQPIPFFVSLRKQTWVSTFPKRCCTKKELEWCSLFLPVFSAFFPAEKAAKTAEKLEKSPPNLGQQAARKKGRVGSRENQRSIDWKKVIGH